MRLVIITVVNILLNDHFVAKLGDYGFARAKPKCEGGKSYWNAVEAYGTPGYMAPEVSRCEVRPGIDVYAFGVVSIPLFITHCNSLILLLKDILEVYSELKAFDKKRRERQTLVI